MTDTPPAHDSPPPGPEPEGGLPPTDAEQRRAAPENVQQPLAQAGRSAGRPSGVTPLRVALTAILLGSLGYLLATTGVVHGPHHVPSAIQGTWVTNDSAYAGRSFEITASTLVIRRPGAADSFRIVDLHHAVQHGHDMYTLQYGMGGSHMAMTFVFRSTAAAGEIQFLHQPSLWWHRR